MSFFLSLKFSIGTAPNDVGFRFLRYIANAALLQLAQTTNGLVLCKQLYDWLMTSNVIGSYMPQIIKLRTAIESGEGEAAQRRQPRQLSSVEMSFYTNYNASPIATVSGDRKTFNPDICWLLPSEGTGFSVYNRDDLIIKKRAKFKDEYGYDQVGTKETVENIIRLAKEWNTLHPERLLQIGDMSRPGGINTPDHAGHENGKIVDIRPLRNDSQIGDPARLTYKESSIYDQNLTLEFVRLALKLFPGMLIRFNDPKIARLAEFSGKIKTDSQGVHNDHLHLEFP
jgi:hypothetical protein